MKGDGLALVDASSHDPGVLDDFFENIAVPLHIVSRDGTVLRANRAELRMLGYAAHEYIGRPIADFHVDPDVIADILDRLRRGQQLVDQPARLRAKDGAIREVQITSNARMHRGELVNSRCCTIDVTEQLRDRRILSLQERKLAITYEHAGIGIAEVDAEGRLLRINPHLAALLGYGRDQLLGRSIFDSGLADVTDEDRAQFLRQARGEIDQYTIEKRFRRPGGAPLWVSITSSSVRDDAGRFLYAVRVQQDITARRAAEETLARRVDELSALYRFTDAMRRSDTLDAVYGHAVTAIVRALRCDRASILIFDAAGVMKFVAWRGLSDRYRAAVEGHSPWRADTRDPAPITIEDVDRADLGEELREHVRAEGLAALAFVPIVADGQLIGKFMTYYDRPHRFADDEIHLASTIARQLGLAIERVRAESARTVAESAAYHLAAIVESSDDAIVSKTLDGVIETWNRGAERLFGWTAQEAVGRPITLIIPPDRLHEEPSILAKIRAGESVSHFETVRQRKDGSLVHIALTVSPLRDRQGRIVGASKIARDITERKEAEAKLRQSEQQLRDLISAIPAAIYTTDAQGRVTYFNDAAVELAGRTPDIGSDQWCVTWKLYRPDGTPLPHDQCPMAVALREGRAIRDAEAIAERPDGTRVPFIPYPTPLRDSDGRIVGAINMLVDISERKSAETRQRVLFNELNHRVKNNMQTLQSLLHIAGRKARNAEAQVALREASHRVAAMAAAQQVLYGTINARFFNAQSFVSAVCGAAKQALPDHARIQCHAEDIELPNDVAMPLALVLNELVMNAAKHGADAQGGANVRVRLAKRNGSLALDVEDDGPGFDWPAVRGQSSGLRLVEGLAGQVRGTFHVTRAPYTRCTVQFAYEEAR